jgi:hypothetical protein
MRDQHAVMALYSEWIRRVTRGLGGAAVARERPFAMGRRTPADLSSLRCKLRGVPRRNPEAALGAIRGESETRGLDEPPKQGDARG